SGSQTLFGSRLFSRNSVSILLPYLTPIITPDQRNGFLHIARGPRNSANARAQRRNLRARDYFVCTSASARWFRRYKALEDETLPAIPDRCWCIYADVATWIELPTANLCARF